MAIVTSYTEDALKVYLAAVLGDTATYLKWTVADGDYDEVVNEALYSYGADAIGDISGRANIRKLRMIARRELWRAVMAAASRKHSITSSSPGGGSTNEGMVFDHAKEMFEMESENIKRDYPSLSLTNKIVSVPAQIWREDDRDDYVS